MDYNKAEVIKDCRELLHLINCEIVVDVSDGQLFNVLFQSDVKKETLLKWLIQQMYSIESYTNNSMEDLVSMFISKSQYRSFLIGTMPISEQYKKWKLIMSALHKKQKRLDCNETIDYDEGITSGNLLVKYEKFWNEKSDFALKYINPTIELPKKANFHELQAEMETAKELLSQWKSEEKCITEKLNVEENRIPPFESYKRSNENFNKVLEQEFLPYLINARNAEGQYAFRYEHLDPKIIKNITKHAQALNNNMETMNGVLRGIENYKNQEQANASLN